MSAPAAPADLAGAVGAVPVIDIGALRGADAAARAAVAQAIGQASASVGFYYIANHGIPQTTIDAAVAASRAFFASPLEQRMAIRLAQSNRGYAPLFDGVHPDEKPDANEGFELGYEAPLGAAPPTGLAAKVQAPNRWPDLPGFRSAVLAYYDATLATSLRLLEAYALYFGLAEDFFTRAFSRPVADMRLAHYPVSEQIRAVSEFGTGAHTDHGIITLLWQDDCGGLEVHLPQAGWAAVPPMPGTLVVNIGELMTRWTNGRLTSTLHRVINRSGRDRYSIPLFVHPNADTLVDPCDLPGVTTAGARFPPIVSGEYLVQRFSGYRQSWQEPAQA